MDDKRRRAITIAIDGPAGAGKSTVAKRLAFKMGLRYLDSGAMYRCVALVAFRLGLGPKDLERAAQIAEAAEIEFREPERADSSLASIEPNPSQRVFLNGEDVTDAIRMPEIGDLASALSVYPPLRRALVRKQRAIVSEGRCVLEGRDAATVIAPDADLKVFLTANLRTRAERRLAEFRVSDPSVKLEEVERQIAERDERDSTRADSPLAIAEGAVVVDTSGMSIEEVVSELKSLADASGDRKS